MLFICARSDIVCAVGGVCVYVNLCRESKREEEKGEGIIEFEFGDKI